MGSQRVVAFLAVHHQVLQRRFVAGSLWPDTTDDRARASLRSALWRAGQVAHGLIAARSADVTLSDSVRVDLTAGMDLAHRVSAEDLSELVLKAPEFEEDLLPDWYDEWIVDVREQWRQVRLHALEAVSRLLLAAGDNPGAIETGLAAVHIDPLRDSAQRALIEAHLAEGNAAEAVRQFSEYRERLRAELGLEPSLITTRLVDGSLPQLEPAGRGSVGVTRR